MLYTRSPDLVILQLCTLWLTSPVSPTSTRLETTISFSVSPYLISLGFTYKWDHAFFLKISVSGLISLSIISSGFIHVTEVRDFFLLLFFKKIFLWMCWLLVETLGIFSCGMWDPGPWPGSDPRRPALGVQSLSHWTTREVLLLKDLNIVPLCVSISGWLGCFHILAIVSSSVANMGVQISLQGTNFISWWAYTQSTVVLFFVFF